MGTKTADENGTKTGDDTPGTAGTGPAADTPGTEEAPGTGDTSGQGEAGQTPGPGDTPGAEETAHTDDTPQDETPDEEDDAPLAKEAPSGVGQGAGAVVSAGLGIVSLTGSWAGTVASARQSLIGQLETSSSSSVATMIEKGYGDAWQATALWGGMFALLALVVGVAVLARPAFGAPAAPQAPWIKSVAWAGIALGVLGLLLAVLKYTDLLLALPTST
ncbi:hypothetical protein [Streptomyces tagetis]|uniref:Uncharacterized protein n=1 Tax=Streptomyces tagetis TaxID=2820809 RepID=A0A940XNE8_9ACTN|nr:hypothetical protein [Streptomyces sp. RG38]MBQ0828020.1 hypothetical protein [Streptomyces sp. RG38]